MNKGPVSHRPLFVCPLLTVTSSGQDVGGVTSLPMTDLWSAFLPQIPTLLDAQDPTTGRFGTDPWIIQDQNLVWPLAVAWATDHRDNPHHHSDEVLAAIIAGGDALIAEQDAEGKWEFRKKDGSSWGATHMPWTYSRWIRAWALVRDAMPPERRDAWDAALTLGVDNIVATVLTSDRVHNIPAHHAMGVFAASQVLDRPDWASAARDYLHRVVAHQDPGGFWPEFHGPAVNYNFVYIDALGAYLDMSGDDTVRPALERAATFHANLTYPDGSMVETVDERNPYEHRLAQVSAGFTVSPLGRGYVDWLLAHRDAPLIADALAWLIRYRRTGPTEAPPGDKDTHRFVLGEDALSVRDRPWFAVLSAYHAPQAPSRWFQDRQAHLSLFHDAVGLIISGSNTRLQPRWSTFTVGDTSLLAHTGEEEPDFSSVPGLTHVPTGAQLRAEDTAVDLDLAGVACSVSAQLLDDTTSVVRLRLDSAAPDQVESHTGFLPHVGQEWSTAHTSSTLDETEIRLTGADCGGHFSHAGWTVELPDDALVEWPVRPHNPYTKDGSASLDHARIVITLGFGTTPIERSLTVRVRTGTSPDQSR